MPQEYRDVRMTGFATRSTVAQALQWLDQLAACLPAENCPLDMASGRVLESEVISAVNVPEFRRSAMDGYAIRADETIAASDYSPVELRILGESLPARPCNHEVVPGTCVRIMTGAPIPDSADSVIPVENTRPTKNGAEITEPIPIGKNVGQIGEDISIGQRVLPAGRRLRPQDVAVAASLGLSQIPVIRRPRVRIIVTGNELATPGQPRAPYQIYDSNSYMLRGLIERDGGLIESILHLPDQEALIRNALTSPGCDVILVSGGSSVGTEDFAPRLLAETGELPIHGIAMRPSSPTGLGRIDSVPVMLLPGNPVSCLCAYDFFAGRVIRRLGGLPSEWPYPYSIVPLTRKLVSAIGRVDYCRVRRTESGIEPLALSGASVLSSTTRADGFVIVPEMSEGYGPGTEVTVYWYDSFSFHEQKTHH